MNYFFLKKKSPNPKEVISISFLKFLNNPTIPQSQSVAGRSGLQVRSSPFTIYEYNYTWQIYLYGDVSAHYDA